MCGKSIFGLWAGILIAAVSFTVNAQETSETELSIEAETVAQQPQYGGSLFSEREQWIDDVLQQDAHMDYKEQRFGDIFEEIKSDYDIPIVLDETARENALAEDTLITITINGVSLRAALRLMLRPYQCTFTINNEVLYILSEDSALDVLETRIYDCRSLMESVSGEPNQNFKKLEQLITSIVDPDSWTINGGSAHLAEFGGMLVIRQSHQSHHAIAKLLRSIDEKFRD